MICCDKCITVFSFNGRAYDSFVFDGVSIFGSDGIKENNSGFEENNSFKIRIPTTQKISVAPGDRVVFGIKDAFDAENAYTVMSVKDNTRGVNKHFLIEIK